jgi:hypothetical protein
MEGCDAVIRPISFQERIDYNVHGSFLLLLGLLTQVVMRHKKIDHALRRSTKVTTALPFRCCAQPQVVRTVQG